MISTLGLAVMSASGVLLCGCASDSATGYTFASTYDTEIETVGVPIFDNTTFVTGLEGWLTDAVVKEIQGRTPWRVTGSDRAQTVLSGRITDVRLGRLSRVRSVGTIEEQPLAITVEFTWRDARSGEILVARDRFRVTSTYVPSRGVAGEPGERLEIGQRDAIGEMAAAIVDELRSKW